VFIVLIIALAILQQVDARPKQKIYQSIEDKINAEGSADVIVRLSTEAGYKVQKSAKTMDKNLQILEDSKIIKKGKELKIINAYSGEITKTGLKELKNLEKQGYKVEIYEDVVFYLDGTKDYIDEIRATLNNSIPSIGANYSWDTLNITGRNVTVAVIDTGIDYNHEDLGNCTITLMTNDGINESIAVVQSAHDYANNFDYTWNITNANYSQIGLHFRNITLEYDGQSLDINGNPKNSNDRLIIYDSQMREIAVYKGVEGGINDVWTPYSDSSTIYVHLKTDDATTNYGFYIDQIRNGTTNTTYNWSACERYKPGWDFVNNDGDPMDDSGHGTHVAGIIGANGTIKGVAPEVDFMALKACDNSPQPSCLLSDIIAAIEWATYNDADVISMSIGGSFSDTIYGNIGKDSTSLATEAAVNSGKIVVIAAGNHGPGISTIAVPGAAENVITVGAIYDLGTPAQTDDVVWSGSSRGPSAFGRLDPDIVAPGLYINSTIPNDGYEEMSGTSMATPHISGVAALMLEQNNTLTPADVRRILMQSAVNISGRVFDVGAGEVNVKNALTYGVSAIVDARNSYYQTVSTDRWEFISPINGTEYANITIYNDNEDAINFTLILTDFENMENSIKLNNTQFSVPQNIVIPANDFYTLEINFTTNNFSGLYATTYGGKLMLLGNDSKNISIPIIVSVPIKNYANLIRTLYESGSTPYGDPITPDGNGDLGDVLYYAYYNPKSGDETITISWNSSSNDLDLYVYNSTADLDDNSGNAYSDSEGLTTTNSDTTKWIRIHGFYFTPSPFNFTLNITDDGNIAPNITRVTNADDAQNFNFSINQNITLIFYYEDQDNDSLTVALNDSRYTQQSLNENNATYVLASNNSILGAHTVRLTVQDDYGAIAYQDVIVGVYDVQITSFYPLNLTPVVRKNDTINFSQTSVDPDNNPLEYFWYIDGMFNTSEQNLTLNTTNMPNDNYNITFRTTNNVTNTTKTWNLTIDQYGPTIDIISPNGTINNSIVRINISASDSAGVANCKYNINNSATNFTIANCINATTYLASGNYRITIYSTDNFGFSSTTNKTFNVSDSIDPTIISASPSGDIDYDSSVTLTVIANEYVYCKYDENDTTYTYMDHSFETSGITSTQSYSVDPETDYLLYIKCADLSNRVQSTEVNFTTGKKPSSSSSSSSSGGTTPPPVNSTSSKYSIFIDETKDGSITVNTNSDKIYLKYLYIKLLQDKKNVELSIIQYDINSAPSTITYFDSEKNSEKRKYAFIEVKHTALENSDIENVKMRFKVLKTWINDNSIDINSIKAYRYTDSWNEVQTKIYSQDSESATYETTSPGLSYFIVAGKQTTQTASELPQNNNEITGDQVLVKKDVNQEKPLTIADVATPEQSSKSLFSPIIITIVIVTIITIVAADIVIVKKRNIAKLAGKEEQINDLKKRYMFEGDQIIQEYNIRIHMLAKDPMKQQKALVLKQQHDTLIQDLHSKYVNLINQVKNSK
jgi:subtilisin family serine protease